MSLWSSRTKMEHAKTRAIETKKPNGKDHEEDNDLDEIEKLETTIDIQKQTIEHQKDTIKIMSGTIDKQEVEINRLRELIDKNSIFMQQIIIELINKPAPKTAAQLMIEAKEREKVSAVSSTAGPKGKLP